MIPSPLDAELHAALAELEAGGLLRAEPAEAHGLDFTSSDYLGLRSHPAVVSAMAAALEASGAGSGASRLLGGSAGPARAAERAAADWVGSEDALLFASGYHANLGLVGALVGRGDTIVSDRLCHASLIDAARLSRATVLVFDHNDPEHAEALLRKPAPEGRKLLLTEGLFSMDGDVAPLPELAAVARRTGAWLIVDEAHSTGVLGPAGRGAWAAADVAPEDRDRLAARILTGGKALGVSGAFVASSAAMRTWLLNRARTQLFTTAPPPAVCAGLQAAIAICGSEEGDAARARLRANAKILADKLGRKTPPGAILPVPVGDAGRAVAVAERLAGKGLDVRAVRPPTVPKGTARLRVVVHAQHSQAELEHLRAELLTGLTDSREQAPPLSLDPTPLARPFVVFGTDTDVGKTVASAACVLAASADGPTTYWKPVQTGDFSDTLEVQRLTGDCRVLPPAFEFPLPASPHEAAAAAGSAVDLEALRRALLHARAQGSKHLIVEPAGGLCVPLTDDVLTVDWFAPLRPTCLMVARSGLGTLNHTLLSLEALAARGMRPDALLMIGDPHPSNRATLARVVPRVFELPRLEPLSHETLAAWVRASLFTALFES